RAGRAGGRERCRPTPGPKRRARGPGSAGPPPATRRRTAGPRGLLCPSRLAGPLVGIIASTASDLTGGLHGGLGSPIMGLCSGGRAGASARVSGRWRILMVLWALFLVLALVGPAQAQSMTETFLESDRARLVTLRQELTTLVKQEPQSDEELTRLIRLRLEIRRVEGRIKAIEQGIKEREQEQQQQ